MPLAANHPSWLDIPVLHAARYCRFISKSDVQAWPIVGTLATAGGTLYIHRESRCDALRMVHDMRQALEEGQVLAIFPKAPQAMGAICCLSCQLVASTAAGRCAGAAGRLAFCRGRYGCHQLRPQLCGR